MVSLIAGCAHPATGSTARSVAPREFIGCYVVEVRTDSAHRLRVSHNPPSWMERASGAVRVDTIALDSSLTKTGWSVPKGVVSWQLRVPRDRGIYWWTWSGGVLELIMADGFVHEEFRLTPTVDADSMLGRGAMSNDTSEQEWYSLAARRAACLGYTYSAT